MPLNFGGQKRSGAFDTVWPSAKVISAGASAKPKPRHSRFLLSVWPHCAQTHQDLIPPAKTYRENTTRCCNNHVVTKRSVACLTTPRVNQKAQAHSLLGGFSLDYCYTQQNFQATSRVSIPHHTTSNTESKPWKADSSTEILPHDLRGDSGAAPKLLDAEPRVRKGVAGPPRM